MQKIKTTNPRPVPSLKNQVHSIGLNMRAFTLVELIVVITILAILGTIAFISLQGYSRDARDSVRVSDLSNIEKQLELYLVKGSKLPIPDEAIILESTGVTIGYQGYIGEESLNKIGVNGGGKDPLDDTYYTYRINSNKSSYQIMGYLEKEIELTKRYPILYGNILGILVDQATNKPLDKIETGTVELRTYTTNQVDMYLSTTSKKTGIGTGTTQLYGTLETLSQNQNFTLPLECPTGFIEVPGNRELGQPSFCVAKYEMSFEGLTAISSFFGSPIWNSYSYFDNGDQGIVVSQQGNSPISNITQSQAIEECNEMGEGYHLITNNEWMTIARNIEQQGLNWSSGIVGNGYIYNGISDDLIKGCSGTGSSYLPSSTEYGTVTGHDICNGKNKLTLSNGEQIWDLSGNLGEFVNKANTLDGTNYNLGQTTVSGSSNGTGGDDDGIYSTDDMDKYGSKYYLGTDNGMGNIYYANGEVDNIFIRGGIAMNIYDTGLFLLDLSGTKFNYFFSFGFRCSK